MAHRIRDEENRKIGLVEYWGDAFIRSDPTLHDSTTPSLHVFI